MNPLQLEVEIERIARSMMTRNAEIGNDLISDLRTKLPVDEVAGLILVSIQRVVYFDIDSVSWTIKHLIPVDVKLEMKKIITFTLYQQLISKKFIPGKDFSVDASGKLLVNDSAKTAVFCS